MHTSGLGLHLQQHDIKKIPLIFASKHQTMEDEDFQQEVHEIVQNQLADNDPKEVAQTLKKLKLLGIDEEQGKTLIGKCLAIELLDVIQNEATYNAKRYINNLKRLPMEPNAD